MAMTDDYLEYLDRQIEIAPANSQEELQAAQCIAGVFRDHGLDPTVQEFDAPAMAGLVRGALMVALFLGALLSGLGSTAPAVIGVVLSLAASALLVLDHVGNPILTKYGPLARSQNVVACHRATGDLAAKGNRPIVIVAHYDTPREDLLSRPGLVGFRATIKRAGALCVPAVALLSLLQVVSVIPEGARRALWVVAILAAVPVLAMGISLVAGRFLPCTPGANDNKAALAAMLGILEKVRPRSASRATTPPDQEEPPAEGGGEPREERPRGPVPVRHGKAVIEGLHMLPEACELTYVAPTIPGEPGIPDMPRPAGVPVARPRADQPSEEAAAAPSPDETQPLATTPIRRIPESRPRVPEGRPFGRKDASGLDTMAQDADYDPLGPSESAGQQPAPGPQQVDDPEWGKTSFRPGTQNIARRAALFDLPDPSVAAVDPLSVGTQSAQDAPRVNPRDLPESDFDTAAVERTQMAQKLAEASVANAQQMPAPVRLDDGSDRTSVRRPQKSEAPSSMSPLQDEIGYITPKDLEEKPARKKLHLPFGHKKKQDEESMSDWLGVDEDYDAKRDGRSIGSWENFDEDERRDGRGGGRAGHWKGGATPASQFRVIEGSAPAPADAAAASGDSQLRDAILSMGDDALVSHDIWFVAAGASELDHAGIKAFLADYRTAVRGSFLVNLDCIGSGVPTVLTEEGLSNRRKADRRLVNLLTSTADDLHCPLAKAAHGWEDTDATPAMRLSMRSATIMGVGDGGEPSLSHTAGDLPEAVDAKQVEDVCELVTEAIRRS